MVYLWLQLFKDFYTTGQDVVSFSILPKRNPTTFPETQATSRHVDEWKDNSTYAFMNLFKSVLAILEMLGHASAASPEHAGRSSFVYCLNCMCAHTLLGEHLYKTYKSLIDTIN
jgi:hypothetical protein